jgi:hypothetical protein
MSKASKKSTFILLATILIFPLQQAMAWGVTGHRVVAEIASKHLSKKAKAGLKEILGRESLALWANWADFVKSDSTWNHAYHWHFVDAPGHITKEVFMDSLKKQSNKNLYTQIPAMLAEIKDKSLPLQTRKNALAFLIHLVGDLHQPLHVGRDEDQGGNKISVYWFDKKTNLHSVWDVSLIDFQQYSYTEYAKEIDIAPKATVDAYKSGTLDDWFYEGHVISDKIYDLTPAESKLSYKYNYLFANDLNNQLLKGGLRLAELLNRCFE